MNPRVKRNFRRTDFVPNFRKNPERSEDIIDKGLTGAVGKRRYGATNIDGKSEIEEERILKRNRTQEVADNNDNDNQTRNTYANATARQVNQINQNQTNDQPINMAFKDKRSNVYIKRGIYWYRKEKTVLLDYILELQKKYGQESIEMIYQVSYKKIEAFAVDDKTAHKIANEGVEINGERIKINLMQPGPVKYTIKNIMPWIHEDEVYAALESYAGVVRGTIEYHRLKTITNGPSEIKTGTIDITLVKKPNINIPQFVAMKIGGDYHRWYLAPTSVVCFNCGRNGHYVRFCEKDQDRDEIKRRMDMSLGNREKSIISGEEEVQCEMGESMEMDSMLPIPNNDKHEEEIIDLNTEDKKINDVIQVSIDKLVCQAEPLVHLSNNDREIVYNNDQAVYMDQVLIDERGDVGREVIYDSEVLTMSMEQKQLLRELELDEDGERREDVDKTVNRNIDIMKNTSVQMEVENVMIPCNTDVDLNLEINHKAKTIEEFIDNAEMINEVFVANQPVANSVQIRGSGIDVIRRPIDDITVNEITIVLKKAILNRSKKAKVYQEAIIQNFPMEMIENLVRDVDIYYEELELQQECRAFLAAIKKFWRNNPTETTIYKNYCDKLNLSLIAEKRRMMDNNQKEIVIECPQKTAQFIKTLDQATSKRKEKRKISEEFFQFLDFNDICSIFNNEDSLWLLKRYNKLAQSYEFILQAAESKKYRGLNEDFHRRIWRVMEN